MRKFYILLFVCISLTANAQKLYFGETTNEDQLVLDLSVGEATIKSTIDKDKEYSVILINKVPSAHYSVKMEVVDHTITPIVTPSEFSQVQTKPEIKDEKGNFLPNCKELQKLVSDLNNSLDEAAVKINIRNLDEYLRLSEAHFLKSGTDPKKDKDHDGCAANEIEQAHKALSGTYKALPKFKLGQYEVMTITITRTGLDNSEKGKLGKIIGKQETKFIFNTTRRKGEWRTMYGFTGISTRAFFRDEQYYLKTITVAETSTVIPATSTEPSRTETTPARTEYEITKEDDPTYFNLATAVFFTWIDYKKLPNKWVDSWTVGLGFDFQTPVLYLGHQATYQQNICLNYGIAIAQQDRLNGRYTPGQKIQENLTTDQLHTRVYRPSLYLGLSIRFNSNPIPTNLSTP